MTAKEVDTKLIFGLPWKAIREAKHVCGSDGSAIPVEYFGGNPIPSLENIERVDGFTVSEQGGKTAFRLSASASQGAFPAGDFCCGCLPGHGTSNEQPINFNNAIPLNSKTEFPIRDLSTNEGYACKYVSADDLGSVGCFPNLLNFRKVQKIDSHALIAKVSLEDVKEKLIKIIQERVKQTEAKPRPVGFQLCIVTISHNGIDVPSLYTFYSRGAKPFRKLLMKTIFQSSIGPSKLTGTSIPQVTAKPFRLTKERSTLRKCTT
ncbi:hypothetical protein B9Z19DRAFT_1063476 [Tuber borchii]|uniref:Uncharacterized protein n=1 Tax=Tuber borchii TaxID=42251 RepID=A0A2T6ZY12_TUBBO|nr:hypothetical protein B9Z19DRAFT_1063476 [Tuber borchii]